MIKSETIRERTRVGVEMTAFIMGFPSPLGEGRCLVRMFSGKRLKHEVFIIAEIATNPHEIGIATRIPELVAVLQQDLAIPGPDRLLAGEWYAHYGPFSYYEDFGTEIFTTVSLGLEEGRYADSIEKSFVLSAEQAKSLHERLSPPPVEDVLARLGERV